MQPPGTPRGARPGPGAEPWARARRSPRRRAGAAPGRGGPGRSGAGLLARSAPPLPRPRGLQRHLPARRRRCWLPAAGRAGPGGGRRVPQPAVGTGRRSGAGSRPRGPCLPARGGPLEPPLPLSRGAARLPRAAVRFPGSRAVPRARPPLLPLPELRRGPGRRPSPPAEATAPRQRAGVLWGDARRRCGCTQSHQQRRLPLRRCPGEATLSEMWSWRGTPVSCCRSAAAPGGTGLPLPLPGSRRGASRASPEERARETGPRHGCRGPGEAEAAPGRQVCRRQRTGAPVRGPLPGWGEPGGGCSGPGPRRDSGGRGRSRQPPSCAARGYRGDGATAAEQSPAAGQEAGAHTEAGAAWAGCGEKPFIPTQRSGTWRACGISVRGGV